MHTCTQPLLPISSLPLPYIPQPLLHITSLPLPYIPQPLHPNPYYIITWLTLSYIPQAYQYNADFSMALKCYEKSMAYEPSWPPPKHQYRQLVSLLLRIHDSINTKASASGHMLAVVGLAVVVVSSH